MQPTADVVRIGQTNPVSEVIRKAVADLFNHEVASGVELPVCGQAEGLAPLTNSEFGRRIDVSGKSRLGHYSPLVVKDSKTEQKFH